MKIADLKKANFYTLVHRILLDCHSNKTAKKIKNGCSIRVRSDDTELTIIMVWEWDVKLTRCKNKIAFFFFTTT